AVDWLGLHPAGFGPVDYRSVRQRRQALDRVHLPFRWAEALSLGALGAHAGDKDVLAGGSPWCDLQPEPLGAIIRVLEGLEVSRRVPSVDGNLVVAGQRSAFAPAPIAEVDIDDGLARGAVLRECLPQTGIKAIEHGDVGVADAGAVGGDDPRRLAIATDA